MVRPLIYVIALCLFLPSLSMAAPQLVLQLNKTEIQLGYYINAELYGIDLQDKLINIDLRSLEAVFGVTSVETAEEVEDARWPNRSVQVRYLKLYPRQEGSLTIPELSLEGIRSKQQTILVTPGLKHSRLGDLRIQRNIRISSSRPWERQQVVIEVEIETVDAFASLASEDLTIAGFEVFSIPVSSEKIMRNTVDYSVMRLGWVLFPLSSGQHRVDVPPVRYLNSGRVERTYYFPEQEINVQALPTYIPPTMPVGKITITSRLESDKLIQPGVLRYWNIVLTGEGVSTSWIPAVVRQIKSGNDIDILPIKTQRSNWVSRDRLLGQVTHQVPFKATVNGRLDLPKLRFQYFDPTNGRIMTDTHQAHSVLALGMVTRFVIAGLGILSLFWPGQYFYRRYSLFRQRRRLRQRAVTAIKEANTLVELRMTLKLLAEAEGWPVNMTLGNFTQHWCANFGIRYDFNELINRLSLGCYSKEPEFDLEVSRAALLAQVQAV